jgi:hypothetical protein
MPSLPQNTALAIETEKPRVLFAQARDGAAPEGKRAAALSLTEGYILREWLHPL